MLTSGDPLKSWSEAIISVLHKEGKDSALCEGYRPVSLLCNDLKILTNILAKQMQKKISKFIKTDKMGFIPGANNIRRTLNVISSLKNKPQPAMLLSIDAQKGFNKVKYNFYISDIITIGLHSNF